MHEFNSEDILLLFYRQNIVNNNNYKITHTYMIDFHLRKYKSYCVCVHVEVKMLKICVCIFGTSDFVS